MNKSLRRRVAAVATTATVGGLLLPFLAAGSALAVAPTSLTVSPTSAATNTATAFTFNVTPNTTQTTGIFYQVVTGPDSMANGAACTAPAAPATFFTCTVTPSNGPGTDNVRFFYDTAAAATTPYVATDPTTTANLTVAGPVSKIVLAPVTSSVAASVYSTYTATATDVGGRPVVNAAITASATEPNTSAGDLVLTATAPASPGYISPNVAASPATTTATATPLSLTAGSSSSATPGVATFYVASRSVGSVAVSVVSGTNPGVGNSGILTVNGGMPNDVSKVTITPTTQRAFTGLQTSVVVNLQNKQGNTISGVVPVFGILSGPNSTATVTSAPVSGASDATGNVTETYTAANAGQDSLQAYVNYAGGQNTLESGEPSATAVVNVAASDVTGITDNGNAHNFTVPLSSSTTAIRYTVANTGQSLAGYNVKFTIAILAGTSTSTLSATSGITDANGNVSVTVTNPTPTNNDQARVTATLGASSDAATVTYAASAVSGNTISIAPFANTTPAKGTATFSVSAADQFGAPQSGLLYDWVVSGRNSAVSSASGASSTFSYTDTGAASSTGFDTVSVSARNASGSLGSTNVTQYWVTTSGMATQANIDLGTTGAYTPNNSGLPAGQTGPIIASGFTKNKPSVGVTADPTSTTTATPQTVLVKLTDNFPNALYGKSVSLSSSGVGVFTDYKGNPLGTSTTAIVSDASAHAKPQYANFTTAEAATVFVRSTQSGTQTITATVDGITTTATVTYTGQFVGVTPVRAMDTRTGQGGLTTGTTGTGSAAPAGPLAPNTSYTLNYGAAGIPLNASAYAFNITAVHPGGLGNLRVAPFATNASAPTTSLVNYRSGSDVANFVIVPNVGGFNALQLYSAASSADVTIDFVGSYATAGSVTSTTPSRIADTRSGATPVAVGETRSFQVAGQGNIPASGAKAVALNVTAVNPGGLGNLRIFADGDALPTTSNINYIPGQDKSAFVIVNLPANGKIDVYSAGAPVDVAIDAYASFDKVTSNVVTQTPVRILDTRPGNTLSTSQYIDLQVAGNTGIPANAQAVLVSVTGIHTTGSTGVGNLRVYPSGGTLPTISTLNYVSPTSDVANFAIVPIGPNGKISIDSEGSPTDVAVDVLGYVPAGS